MDADADEGIVMTIRKPTNSPNWPDPHNPNKPKVPKPKPSPAPPRPARFDITGWDQERLETALFNTREMVKGLEMRLRFLETERGHHRYTKKPYEPFPVKLSQADIEQLAAEGLSFRKDVEKRAARPGNTAEMRLRAIEQRLDVLELYLGCKPAGDSESTGG